MPRDDARCFFFFFFQAHATDSDAAATLAADAESFFIADAVSISSMLFFADFHAFLLAEFIFFTPLLSL